MKTFYVDFETDSSGLSESSPCNSLDRLDPAAGDKVLIKCGSFFRGSLKTVAGVYYGSYGEGEKPVFCGSVDASEPCDWVYYGKNLWRFTKRTNGGVGNFVFDGGKTFGTYRWAKEELCAQGDFFDGRPTEDDVAFALEPSEYELLLYSEKNPGEYYSHIEAVVFGERKLCDLKDGITLDGLCFINSGVHGAQGQAENVVINNCDFRNIGGCPWSKELKIRFGNAIEFYDRASRITVKGCHFESVYDSCITYQGNGSKCAECDGFICENNVFDTYGMAAFEYRDKLPMYSTFSNNVCRNAGCGFAMQGEELPRRSEIWPQSMGHHIFLWRISDCRLENGLEIKGNVFGSAPNGAAIYSIIAKEAEKGLDVCGNVYDTKEQLMIARIGGKEYKKFESFRTEADKEGKETV